MEAFEEKYTALLNELACIRGLLNKFEDKLLQFVFELKPDEFYQGEQNSDKNKLD